MIFRCAFACRRHCRCPWARSFGTTAMAALMSNLHENAARMKKLIAVAGKLYAYYA